MTFTSLLSNFQQLSATIITCCEIDPKNSGFLRVYAQQWDCWVIWQFYFQVFCCCSFFLWTKKWFFFLISREKHQIIVFFLGWKEEWIRKFTACFLKCFLTKHWGCKPGGKKKSHWNICNWLFFAWHLVVLWKNCSFDLWERAPWETTGRRNGFGFCSLHSQEPEWITKNWPWKPGRWAVDTEPPNHLIPCHASRETQK